MACQVSKNVISFILIRLGDAVRTRGLYDQDKIFRCRENSSVWKSILEWHVLIDALRLRFQAVNCSR